MLELVGGWQVARFTVVAWIGWSRRTGWSEDYRPLVEALVASGRAVRRKRDLQQLKKGRPLGLKPKQVSEETALKFLDDFLPPVMGEVRAGNAKGKLRMKELKAHLKANAPQWTDALPEPAAATAPTPAHAAVTPPAPCAASSDPLTPSGTLCT